MFGFWKPDKRAVALSEIAGSLPGALDVLHPVERATVLLMANCMLDYAGRTYGLPISQDPRKVDPRSVKPMLDSLLQVRDGLVAMSKEMKDAQRRHVACHLRAAELVILTAGLALGREHAKALAASWRAVWGARESLRHAVPWVRKYERAAGYEAVPKLANGREASDIDLLKAGGTLPAFLRRRNA